MNTTWQDRVVVEHAELSRRLAKLQAYINSDHYEQLDSDMRALLCKQRDLMGRYAQVLMDRLQLDASIR